MLRNCNLLKQLLLAPVTHRIFLLEHPPQDRALASSLTTSVRGCQDFLHLLVALKFPVGCVPSMLQVETQGGGLTCQFWL